MNYIESIMNAINKVFDVSEENISSLKVMLSDIEAAHLYNKFSAEKQSRNYLNRDLLSKANLLNALLEIVLENPNLDLLESEKRKEMLMALYGAAASLYEQVLNQIPDHECWNYMRYLVMYSMLAYLADRQTMSDLVIREYNIRLVDSVNLYNESPTIQKLEYDAYYLIVLLMSNIKNYDGLMQLNSLIERANTHLDKAQMEELQKEQLDISAGMKIASYGNIIYLTTVLKSYLFSGRIESSEDQNIYSVIDMYSFNAFHLLSHESIELKLIGHLLRYAYVRVADNSIWNIAEKSPLIRKFIEENLSKGSWYIYSLLPSQREVISDVLTPKKSIVVGMPTSAGKSLLAEMQILFTFYG